MQVEIKMRQEEYMFIISRIIEPKNELFVIKVSREKMIWK